MKTQFNNNNNNNNNNNMESLFMLFENAQVADKTVFTTIRSAKRNTTTVTREGGRKERTYRRMN
jgi:hypothetical protein